MTPATCRLRLVDSRLAIGGGGRIRTFEGVSRQIYSLLPLAAWVPLPGKTSRVFSFRPPGVSTALARLLLRNCRPQERRSGDASDRPPARTLIYIEVSAARNPLTGAPACGSARCRPAGRRRRAKTAPLPQRSSNSREGAAALICSRDRPFRMRSRHALADRRQHVVVRLQVRFPDQRAHGRGSIRVCVVAEFSGLFPAPRSARPGCRHCQHPRPGSRCSSSDRRCAAHWPSRSTRRHRCRCADIGRHQAGKRARKHSG